MSEKEEIEITVKIKKVNADIRVLKDYLSMIRETDIAKLHDMLKYTKNRRRQRCLILKRRCHSCKQAI